MFGMKFFIFKIKEVFNIIELVERSNFRMLMVVNGKKVKLVWL